MRDRLYRNDAGTFTDVTDLLGEQEPCGYGLAVCWLDYDNDGDPDLYCVNDKGYHGDPAPGLAMNRNVLWRNDGSDGAGSWVCTEVAEAARLATGKPYWNPRKFDSDQILALLQAAWRGNRPPG